MRIQLEREIMTKTAIIGRLTIENEMMGWTMEPPSRAIKVVGSTAIPAGVYKIKPRKSGGMNQHYMARHSQIHKGMLELQNVPDFVFIYLHIGNFIKDTEGCPLVGTDFVLSSSGARLTQSAKAYTNLYSKVIGEAEAGTLSIQITNTYQSER